MSAWNELSGIVSEDSRGNITRLLKLDREAAEFFHRVDPKFSFELAHAYTLWEVGEMTADHEMFMREIGLRLKKALNANPSLKKDVRLAKGLHDLNVVLSKTKRPDDDLEKVVLKLSGGWYWYKLDPDECRQEGHEMQHCATDHRGDLVSLRDPSGNPHVTMTFNHEKNSVYQIKGKQNKIPDAKYWNHIVTFFRETKARLRDRDVAGSKLENEILAVSPIVREKFMTFSDGSYLAEEENEYLDAEGGEDAKMFALFGASGSSIDGFYVVTDRSDRVDEFSIQSREPGYYQFDEDIIDRKFYPLASEVAKKLTAAGMKLSVGIVESLLDALDIHSSRAKEYLELLASAGAKLLEDYPWFKYQHGQEREELLAKFGVMKNENTWRMLDSIIEADDVDKAKDALDRWSRTKSSLYGRPTTYRRPGGGFGSSGYRRHRYDPWRAAAAATDRPKSPAEPEKRDELPPASSKGSIEVPDAWKDAKKGVDWLDDKGGHTPFKAPDDGDDDLTAAMKDVGAKVPDESEVDKAMRAAGVGSSRPFKSDKDFSDPKASAALRKKLSKQAANEPDPELDRYAKSSMSALRTANSTNKLKLMLMRYAELIDAPIPPSPGQLKKYVDWLSRAQNPDQAKRVYQKYAQELNK